MSVPKEIQAYMVMTGMPKPAGRGSYFSAFGSTKKPRTDRKQVQHTHIQYHLPSRSIFSRNRGQGPGADTAYLLINQYTTLEDFQYAVWWIKEKMRRGYIQVLT